MFYPPRNAAYFFKGRQYVKYIPGQGVQPLSGGQLIRRIGLDGWQTLPAAFREDIDAAFFYPHNHHAYFFKGRHYVKYRPGAGVVELNGEPVRRIGVDGWVGVPDDFTRDLDGVVWYPSNDRAYFFKGRNYLRWTPNEGVDTRRYPRRLGLVHGHGMIEGTGGGWPGLSHVIAGPLIGAVTPTTAVLWIWLVDPASLSRLRVLIDGTDHPMQVRDPVAPAVRHAVEGIRPQSCIAELKLQGLNAQTRYAAEIVLDGVTLDVVSFKTASAPAPIGQTTFVFGSCSHMSRFEDVDVFSAMNRAQADFAMLIGDNCYYMHGAGGTGSPGPRPRDWESAVRMFRRQIQARNHPQFTSVSRTVPFFTTWDDHDFAYNNATGTHQTEWWVGRDIAAGVFRAMWPNGYTHAPDPSSDIRHTFRWGPVAVFMTDNRYHRKADAQTIWGSDQRQWLIQQLAASKAPVKIIVTSSQFLFRDEEESFLFHGQQDRDELMEALGFGRVPASISGRILFLSGDIHYSELLRFPTKGPAQALEFTSSPMRQDVDGRPPAEPVPHSRLWAARRDAFGLVTIDVTGATKGGIPEGTITLEARDSRGSVLEFNGGPCRSTWNLVTGALT
jgi:alkaline phosphatase D